MGKTKETPAQRMRRRERKKEKLAKEDETAKRIRLDAEAQAKRARRAKEDEKARKSRLDKRKLRKEERLAKEDETAKRIRLDAEAQAKRDKRAKEDEIARKSRLDKRKLQEQKKTLAIPSKRLQTRRLQRKAREANESEIERCERQTKNAISKMLSLAVETPEHREERLAAMRERNAASRHLKQHLKIFHSINISASKSTNPKTQRICPISQATFSSRQSLYKHKQRKHEHLIKNDTKPNNTRLEQFVFSNESEHQRLIRDQRSEIARLLASGTSFKDVIDHFKLSEDNNSQSRLHIINIKDLENIAQDFKLTSGVDSQPVTSCKQEIYEEAEKEESCDALSSCSSIVDPVEFKIEIDVARQEEFIESTEQIELDKTVEILHPSQSSEKQVNLQSILARFEDDIAFIRARIDVHNANDICNQVGEIRTWISANERQLSEQKL